MGFSNKVAIGICDRCSFKFLNSELRADGNSPGLRVCQCCWDPKNPWRLPPIKPDNITLQFPRPDTPIGLNGPPSFIEWDTAGFTWDSTQPPLTWDETVNGASGGGDV